MNVKEAIILFRYYQQSHHRKRTIDSYQTLLSAFERIYGDRSLDSLQSDEIYQFLENSTTNSAKSTRRLRYAQLKAFFNFIIDKCHHDMKNAMLPFSPRLSGCHGKCLGPSWTRKRWMR
jgi:site-specific recombinase XerD